MNQAIFNIGNCNLIIYSNLELSIKNTFNHVDKEDNIIRAEYILNNVDKQGLELTIEKLVKTDGINVIPMTYKNSKLYSGTISISNSNICCSVDYRHELNTVTLYIDIVSKLMISSLDDI